MTDNEPKPSPSAMMAAEQVQFAIIGTMGDNITSNDIAQIIDTATQLSKKEAALKELVEAAENRLDVWTRKTLNDLVAAIDNAKKVLEDKP